MAPIWQGKTLDGHTLRLTRSGLTWISSNLQKLGLQDLVSNMNSGGLENAVVRSIAQIVQNARRSAIRYSTKTTWEFNSQLSSQVKAKWKNYKLLTDEKGEIIGTHASYVRLPSSLMSGGKSPVSPRGLTKARIDMLTNQIEARMRALGIPEKNIGVKGIAGYSGRGFEPHMKQRGGNVRRQGIFVDAGVLYKFRGWDEWNEASLATRIDAVIAHEWAEFNGATHKRARDKAPETKLPISYEAKKLLRSQRERGTPEMAPEYDGETNKGPFRPLSSWPRLLNQTTQAIQNAITHLKSPQNLRAFDNALTSAEYLLNKAATEIQKVITDSPSVPRQSIVLSHLGNARNRISAARAQARGVSIFGGQSLIDPKISLHGAINHIQQARQAVGLQ